MPPKKGKGKAAEEPEQGLQEVQKTFYELQIVDCNRRNAKLRSAVDEYTQRLEQLQKDYDKLDEDRADIITYLKKLLNNKTEECQELKEKVKGLEETRDLETKEFNAKVQELEKNFTTMKDQLTSENKLLSGKLNALEEFRAIRDDLMRKYEKQEQDFKDQEMKYKRIIYDTEKKFVVGKEKLKREMEARLLQLAQDFQDATELRIAASTHRVIRENIALNNELDNILDAQAKLATQNEKFKAQENSARVALELAEEERDTAIQKNLVYVKVIDKLTETFQNMKKEQALEKKKQYDFEKMTAKIETLTKCNEDLMKKVRILEQNLHAKITAENKVSQNIACIIKESEMLRNILQKAGIAIKAALKLDQWALEADREIVERKDLLIHLFQIVSKYQELERAESLESLTSLGKVYAEGDLGFVPKITRPSDKGFVPEEIKESKGSSVSTLVLSSTKESLTTEPGVSILAVAAKPEGLGGPSILSIPPSSEEISEVGEEEQEEEEEQKALEDIAGGSQNLTADELEKSMARAPQTKKEEKKGEGGHEYESSQGTSKKQSRQQVGEEEAQPKE